ncbi:MAG: flagellar basal body rod protein FlgB [Veillonellaceae bacterium]|nr:flagellar basal body rod protein FlgB [Veillonellaceae bacterium]MDD6923652.1 flagellar basal body rod protein FlgB [Veillonellaceae bacterium]
MLENIVANKPIDVMERGLQAANLRQAVTADNIANVNTPNFKKSSVIFEDMLAKELGLDDDKRKLKLVRTNDRHLPVLPPGKVYAKTQLDNSTTMRVDNNNVDIDKEMAGLAENQIYFNALTRSIGSYMSRIKSVITSR